jgi:hypothetical protein
MSEYFNFCPQKKIVFRNLLIFFIFEPDRNPSIYLGRQGVACANLKKIQKLAELRRDGRESIGK